MLLRTTFALLLIAQLISVMLPVAAQAQDSGSQRRRNQGGQNGLAHQSGAVFDLEDTKGFPGVGDVNAWQSSRPLYRNGLRLLHQGSWNQAIQKFRASLALYPDDYKAYIGIGRATEEMGGDINDAEKAYRQALKIKSDSWQAWELLSNILYEQKNYDEARQALTNAQQLPVPASNRDELTKLLFRIESAQRAKVNPQQQNPL